MLECGVVGFCYIDMNFPVKEATVSVFRAQDIFVLRGVTSQKIVIYIFHCVATLQRYRESRLRNRSR
jgi:hypothetical protein